MPKDNSWYITTMNKVITKEVLYRNKKIPVEQLKENSNIKIEVECPHGRRHVRWNRRHQLCRRCHSEKGTYSTSPKGRKITWGDKISKAKKGVNFSEAHKESIKESRIQRACKRAGIKRSDFKNFSTKGEQYKLRCFIMNKLKRNLLNKTSDEQDKLMYEKLGYTVHELKSHLESKFERGMSWENYGNKKGQWEIDHIKPESWFFYESTDDPEFKKCHALDNLQPMWGHLNRKKNSLYSGKFKERKLYILGGQSGSGKTTICNKLQDKFNIVDFDKVNIKQLDKIVRKEWCSDKPLLIQTPIKISTLIKRYSDQYDVKCIVILESTDIIKQRIIDRGGSKFSSLDGRYARMISLSNKYASFSGTADEVYSYLRKLKV